MYLIGEDTEFATVEPTYVPDDLAERFQKASEEFWSMQKELRAYFAAVQRDEHADDRFRVVNQARIERGKRRHHRRARPVSSH